MTGFASGADLAKWYLETNVLLAFAWAIFAIGLAAARRYDLPAKLVLIAGRATLAAALLASAATALLPEPRAYDATTGFFDKPSLRTEGKGIAQAAAPGSAPTLSSATDDPWYGSPGLWIMALLSASALLPTHRMLRSIRMIRRLLADALLWRRIGSLHVYVSTQVSVPFSFRTIRRAYIVIPHAMTTSPEDLRIALRHEGQHHRHGDTAALLFHELLALLMPLNPFATLWRRTLSHVQEFACDEALIGRGRFTPQAYGSCLIRVTEAALAGRSMLVGTASMAAEGMGPGSTQRLLERRIVMLKRYSARPSGFHRITVLAIGLLLPALTVSAAYAAKGVKPRDPLSRAEVVKLVEAMDVSPNFPLVVTDDVVTRLNKIVTDPARSQSTREALARMAQHKQVLSGYLTKYGHPAELLAIPLVEAAYKNLPETEHSMPAGHPLRSAGLWQFTQQTARNFGLVVTQTTDQRLDIPLATDAAMRYLGANQLRFKNWLLAVAAYNQGEGKVQEAIAKAGTRDPWRLVETGHLGDYLVYVTTGAILIANPQLVD